MRVIKCWLIKCEDKYEQPGGHFGPKRTSFRWYFRDFARGEIQELRSVGIRARLVRIMEDEK